MDIFGLNGFYTSPVRVGGGGGGATSYYITLDAIAQPVATATWPSHFSVPIESGSLSPNYAMRLTAQYDDGEEIYQAAQFQPASYWPDGSVKWLHIYSDLEWSGGVSPEYKFRYGAGLAANPSTSLSATSTSSGIRIDTGTTSFTILNNSPIINSGSYFMVDAAGNTYNPTGVVTSIESSGRSQIVVKVSGNLSTSGGSSLSKFVTYITANADSDIVKYQHSCIFTADMRQNFVAALGLRFNAFTGQVLTRNFEKKLPFTVTPSGGNTTVWLWPSGRADTNTPSDWADNNAFRFAYLHKGSGSQSVLNVNMPTGYINTCSGLLSSNFYLLDALVADLYGLSMDMDFAINLGTSGTDKQTLFTHKPIGVRETLTSASAKAAENIGAHNEYYANFYDNLFNAAISKFVTNDLAQDYGWTRYGGTYNSFVASGRLNDVVYSNIPGSYHRLSSNDHYNLAKLAYLQFLSSANTGCLNTARIICDHNRAVATIKHDNTSYTSLSGRYIGTQAHAYTVHGLGFNGVRETSFNAEHWALQNHFVHPSRFIYSWLIDANPMMRDAYNAWIDGANQQNIFNNFVPTYSTGAYVRDNVVNVGEMLTYYEMYPNSSTAAIEAAHRWTSGLLTMFPDGAPVNPSGWTDPTRSNAGTPSGYYGGYGTGGRDGTLLRAHDTFVRYADLFPNTTYNGQTVEQWIVKTVDIHLTGNLLEGYSSYASLAAKAYEITGDPKYLAPLTGMLSQVYYNVYQNNDAYYGLSNITNDTVIHSQRAWPRLRKTLLSLSYQVASGYNRTYAYPSRSANDVPTNTDINNRSMKLAIYNNTGSPVELNAIQIAYLNGETSRNAYKSFLYHTTSGTADTGVNLVGVIPPADSGGVVGKWVSRPPYPKDNGYYFVDADISTTLSTGLSYIYSYGYETVKSPVTNLPEIVLLSDSRTVYFQNNSGVFRPLSIPVTGTVTVRNVSDDEYINPNIGYIDIGGSGRWVKQLDTFTYVFTGDTSIFVQGHIPVQILFNTAAPTDTRIGLYGTVANMDIIQPLLS